MRKDHRLSISGPFLSGRNLSQRLEAVLPKTFLLLHDKITNIKEFLTR